MKKKKNSVLIRSKRLKDICEIISGHQFRHKISISSSGEYRILLYKDVNVEKGLVEKVITRSDVEKLDKARLLRKDDVLIIAKGHYPRAVYIPKVDEKIVVSSFFYIIRTFKGKILPEYLTWYLNSEKLKNYLEKTSTGTTIPHLKMKDLEEVKIPLLPLTKQRRIIKMNALLDIEQRLIRKILRLRKVLINEAIKKEIRR
ncbi:restriction endonuclease subunit S [bacterium]|nr:restriction endonuclease subunit S [bacterium]